MIFISGTSSYMIAVFPLQACQTGCEFAGYGGESPKLIRKKSFGMVMILGRGISSDTEAISTEADRAFVSIHDMSPNAFERALQPP